MVYAAKMRFRGTAGRQVKVHLRTSKKLPLTRRSIQNLTHGRIFDQQTPGLMIEILGSGKKRWKYRRQVSGKDIIAVVFGGLYPTRTIGAARKWARKLNRQAEAGIDPRIARREDLARSRMTVDKAHELYIVAVREGRSSRARRKNKPRTITDKLEIYNRDIAPVLGKRSVYEITERDLVMLVAAKGKVAKVRANRLAAELKVFFGWGASLRGLEVGLENDPSRRLGDIKFPETPRQRKLSLEEIEWFLKAVVFEDSVYRRAMLLWLLTAARISEVGEARRSELVNGIWTIPPHRVKNSCAHSIALGPWSRALMETESEWVFPGIKDKDKPLNRAVWYKARDRVLNRMREISGQSIERFTPHDFRRTARSNTKRLRVDFETAEAMLNHLKSGMARIYDRYELEDEKAAWFLKWEEEVAAIARRAGVAEALGVPNSAPPLLKPDCSMSFNLLPASRFMPGKTATILTMKWATDQDRSCQQICDDRAEAGSSADFHSSSEGGEPAFQPE